ncbi:MAG: hypothetical protein QM713_11980 [Arachnia sp.]
MATWRDGAAYAPEERPDGFATPKAEPLPEGEPYRADTPGPVDRPQDLVGGAQVPLDGLGAVATSARDPRSAFQVTSAAMTAATSTSEARRDPRAPFASYAASLSPTAPAAPPTGQPLGYPPPTPPQAPPAQAGPNFPPPVAPNTRELAQYPPPVPGQVPYQGPPPVEATAAQRRLAQIAGALGLAGFLLGSAAPFLLLVAGALGMRTRALSGFAGPVALASGIVFLLWQWATQTLGESNMLAGLASLILAFAFFIAAAKKV